MTTISDVEKAIGIEFKDKNILEKALTHRSFLNESKGITEHNERIEYLGDAVLEFLISKYLYQNYPDRTEGELTSFRSATVKTETLAEMSSELGLGKYIHMSKGEEATGGREKEYLLANTFESVIGAIFLDQGIEVTEEFLNNTLFTRIPMIVEKRLDIDPKTKFQEVAQEKFKLTPTYQLVSETGPDHNKSFTIGVFVGDKEFGRGSGPSKQKAEEAAARSALRKLNPRNKA